MSKKRFICENCWRAFKNQDSFKVRGIFDTYIYCKRCYEKYSQTCSICGERFRKTLMNKIGDEFICFECLTKNFVECEICGKFIPKSQKEDYVELKILDALSFVCKKCSNHLINCPKCNKLVLPDFLGKNRKGEIMCAECLQKEKIHSLPFSEFKKEVVDEMCNLWS